MINEIKVGKIYNFNGETGYIVTNESRYPFSKKDVHSEIKDDDIVSFIPDLVVFGDDKVYVAKFINKYEIENEKIRKKLNDLNITK